MFHFGAKEKNINIWKRASSPTAARPVCEKPLRGSAESGIISARKLSINPMGPTKQVV